MTWLQFIASMVGSLVWPIFTLSVLVFLYKKRQAVLEFLADLRSHGVESAEAGPGGLKIKLAQQAQQAAQQAEQDANTLDEVVKQVAPKLPPAERETLLDAAKTSVNSIVTTTGTVDRLIRSGGPFFIGQGFAGHEFLMPDPAARKRKKDDEPKGG